jgi:hypothetical protein
MQQVYWRQRNRLASTMCGVFGLLTAPRQRADDLSWANWTTDVHGSNAADRRMCWGYPFCGGQWCRRRQVSDQQFLGGSGVVARACHRAFQIVGVVAAEVSPRSTYGRRPARHVGNRHSACAQWGNGFDVKGLASDVRDHERWM